MLRPDKSCFIE